MTGTRLADVIHMGTLPSGATGINLNAATEAAPDADIEATAADGVGLAAGAGNDVLLGRRSGFRRPGQPPGAIGADRRSRPRPVVAGGPLFALGEGGRDRILGSQSPTSSRPARPRPDQGRPRTRSVITAEGGRDRVNCGAGKDLAVVDRKAAAAAARSRAHRDIFEEVFLSAKPHLNTLTT